MSGLTSGFGKRAQTGHPDRVMNFPWLRVCRPKVHMTTSVAGVLPYLAANLAHTRIGLEPGQSLPGDARGNASLNSSNRFPVAVANAPLRATRTRPMPFYPLMR